jgi:uncharacterized protein (DUF1501 family)
MNMNRRRVLASLGGLGGAGALGGLASLAPREARTAGEDYRALVVVWLDGGNDGHNVLIPNDDTSYAEYKTGRGTLAIARDRLSALSAPVNGRRYALHPSLSPLVPMFDQGRLAFLANVGLLVRPTTVAALRAGSAELPPYFGMHVEQSLLVQGATPFAPVSGWAGRGLEALPAELRHAHAGLGAETNAFTTPLVQGERTVATRLNNSRQTWMGWGDASSSTSGVMQSLTRMQRWQHDNAYATEYMRSTMRTLGDLGTTGLLYDNTAEPAGDFGNTALSGQLRGLSRVLPKFMQAGYRRQVFQMVQPYFDTHADQVGGWHLGQDNLLTQLGRALSAFDAAVRANGMDNNVVTLVMTEFGRTLRPATSSGSEHGWGNHWWAFGGPVAGGTFHGSFPSLALNGADDLDGSGTLVPTMASDQVAASVLQWLGVPSSALANVLPNLANFTQKSVPFLRA